MQEYHFERIGEVRPTMSINHVQAPAEFTLPIFGFPRGGTTMVAAVAESFGIYVGSQEDMRRYNFEDQVMNRPELAAIYSRIKDRNANHSRWGWKNPTGIGTLREVAFALRNPRPIVIFRDVIATIMGEQRFDEANNFDRRPLATLAELASRRSEEFFDFFQKCTYPTLIVSYELAIRMPEIFLGDFVCFLNLSPTAEQWEDARARISDGGYLKWDSPNATT